MVATEPEKPRRIFIFGRFLRLDLGVFGFLDSLDSLVLG